MNTLDSFTTQSGDIFKLIQLSPSDDLATLIWKPIAWLPGGYAIVTTMSPDPSEAYGRMFLQKLAEVIGGDFGGPYHIMRRFLDDDGIGSLWLGSNESPVAHIAINDELATWVDDWKLGKALEYPAFREAVADVKALLRRDVEERNYVEYVIVDHKRNPVRVLESLKVMPPHVSINLKVQPKRFDYDADGILQEVS